MHIIKNDLKTEIQIELRSLVMDILMIFFGFPPTQEVLHEHVFIGWKGVS